MWAVIVLLLIWVGLLLLSVRAVRGHSAWGLLVPVAAVGFWLAAVSAGEAFLGWTG
jgi:hypothetical protein